MLRWSLAAWPGSGVEETEATEMQATGVGTARVEAAPLTPDSRLLIPRRRRNLVPYLLLAPSVLFMAIFFAWPMFQALVLAIQDAQGGFSTEPLERMVSDVQFREAIRNTLLLTAVIVPAQVILALVMSLLLMAGLRGGGLFLYA